VRLALLGISILPPAARKNASTAIENKPFGAGVTKN